MNESDDRPAEEPVGGTPRGDASTATGSDDGPAEEPAGSIPRGDVSTATGVAGLVALAQSLEEPWRTVASVAGPWTVIFGRWLANRLETAFHLLESELLLILMHWFVRDKAKIETIEAEVQELRLLLLKRIRERIRRYR